MPMSFVWASLMCKDVCSICNLFECVEVSLPSVQDVTSGVCSLSHCTLGKNDVGNVHTRLSGTSTNPNPSPLSSSGNVMDGVDCDDQYDDVLNCCYNFDSLDPPEIGKVLAHATSICSSAHSPPTSDVGYSYVDDDVFPPPPPCGL